MRQLFTALLFLMLPLLATAQERPNTIIVMDASGSMWGQIDGENKIVIARRVITELLQSLPADQNLGLTVYGHRTRGDCSDIETIVPPGPNTRDQIAAAVAAISPMGKTPMTDAVVVAAEALRYTEEKATVILISDGIETCNPDPCAAAQALESAGIDFTVHVIGFDITDAEAMRQMQCIADETGGLLRSASNADEFLAALTEVMIEPEPEPEPETPVMARVTLTAVLDNNHRSPYPDPLSWTISGGQMPFEIIDSGYQVTLAMPMGSYTVTAMNVIDFSAADASFGVVGPDDVVVTVLMPVPIPLVSIDAPDVAPAGSTITVNATVPDDVTFHIEVGVPGQPNSLSYAYPLDGNPVELILPAQPGLYELRYFLNTSAVIATKPITVTEAAVSLNAPDAAPIGSTIDVGWTGPDAVNDNIQLGPVGGTDYVDYAYLRDGNPVQLVMPAIPGQYELRYHFRDRETILVRPIVATEAEVSLSAPDAAPAGATIDVGWVGPAAENDNIQLGPVGGTDYVDYAYLRDGNPVSIILPAAPGVYELRYRFRDRETIFARPITVTAAEVSLTAPDSALAGSTIDVGWVGPNAENDNIQIGKPGEGYLEYAYTRDGNPLALRLPSEPGIYELRYFFRDTEVIATRSIELLPVTARILAQPTALPGENVVVGWDGPNYPSDYIAIGLPGDPGYDNYTYTSAGNPATVLAPTTPGSYEIRYVTGETVLATVPLEVK